MQTVWKGSIAFGLVSIPVRLVSATEERDVSFRQVRASDGARVRYRRVAEPDGAEVAYADLAKGYELPDGDLVVLTDDDLADLPVPSRSHVDVLEFVDVHRIAPTAFLKAYVALPTGEPKPYALLRDAMVAKDRVAVVKLALRGRERLATLRPQGPLLVVQTMLWPDEVREIEPPVELIGVEPRPGELAMAESYIDAMVGEFDPAAYTDEYRSAVEALVQAKVEGRETVTPPGVEREAEVVDLMEALRRSVAAAQERRAGQA